MRTRMRSSGCSARRSAAVRPGRARRVLPLEASGEPVRPFLRVGRGDRRPDRRSPCLHAVGVRRRATVGSEPCAPSTRRRIPTTRAAGSSRSSRSRRSTPFGDEADFVFNTPNEKSLPGYLKMGWRVVGQVPIRVRVRRPIRFATRARSWRTATEIGGRAPTWRPARVDALTDEDSTAARRRASRHPGIATPRDAAYLRWRYGRAPLLDYRAVASTGPTADSTGSRSSASDRVGRSSRPRSRRRSCAAATRARPAAPASRRPVGARRPPDVQLPGLGRPPAGRLGGRGSSGFRGA